MHLMGALHYSNDDGSILLQQISHQKLIYMKAFTSIMKRTIFLMIAGLSFHSVHAQHYLAENTTVNKVQFAGIDGELLVFDLQLADLPAKGSVLRILDENRNVVHEERIKGTSLVRRYKIVKDNMTKLYFEVSNRQIILKQSFNINYKVETKWEVTKA